ncbi:MAG: hypothetical protein M1813_008031 [Trichoglossum hirsutum]|nr:MAG: hypothetical protein M1813_008031 [Trichoglossum hirsutum]
MVYTVSPRFKPSRWMQWISGLLRGIADTLAGTSLDSIAGVYPRNETRRDEIDVMLINGKKIVPYKARIVLLRKSRISISGLFNSTNRKNGIVLNSDSFTGRFSIAEDQKLGFSEETENRHDERPVAPDQFDPRYETTKLEIWAYYAYYIGNNGLTLFNFAPTAFQNLLFQAAGDPGVLVFAGKYVVELPLDMNPDGHANDNIIAYQTSLTFWTAAFPSLARNTVELRNKADEYNAGTITRDEYDFADMMKRNELSNMSFYIQSVGEIVILAVIVGIMFGVRVNDSEANNNWGLSVLIAFASGVWLLLAIPWFLKEKRRPGQSIPPGMNIISVGFWQLWRALTQIWKLKQSLLYLIGYFCLGDSLNTTVTVIATLQNSIVSYNTLELTYLLLVGITAQAVGIYSFWFVQRKYGINTKVMFNTVAVAIILLDGWGMIGVWTQRFGFHHTWEVWVYQV